MKLKTKEKSINIDDKQIASIQNLNRTNFELLIIQKDRKVQIFDCSIDKLKTIFTLPEYFNIENIAVYSYKNYCCIVECLGTNGLIINLENPSYQKKLSRGDYKVEHCSYPIAFYAANNATYLIHGTDWNRLDITCLETDELLTDRVVDYDTKTNYADYFHSLLSISPDEKSFISNGWVWQPYDIITHYKIDAFQQKFELSGTFVDFEETTGYLWDRPLCWINAETIAVGYNKKEALEEGNFPSELIFINLNKNEIEKRIEFDGFDLNDHGEVFGSLFHVPDKKLLMIYSERKGLLVTDYEGIVQFTKSNFTAKGYSEKHKVFYQLKNGILSLTELNI